MHLAAYYICIMYQQKVFSFGYIRKCKKCGRLFVAAQSRQQFCQAPCTRQAYYIANKRLQKVIEKNWLIFAIFQSLNIKNPVF